MTCLCGSQLLLSPGGDKVPTSTLSESDLGLIITLPARHIFLLPALTDNRLYKVGENTLGRDCVSSKTQAFQKPLARHCVAA